MKYYYTYLPVDYSGGWLFTLAVFAPIILCCRLCFESIRNYTDEIVRKVIESIAAVTPTQPPSLPQMNIYDVESNIPADDESDNDADHDPCKVDNDVDSSGKIKYLTIISGREYIAVYICLTIAFTVYDTIIYNNASGTSWGYWIYFPIPAQIIFSASLSTILAILYAIVIAFRSFVAYKSKAVNEEYCLKHWEECAAIPFLTVLTNYILVHVFWFLLLLVSFPALVALKGVFLIPLSIPVILVLQRMLSCFKILCCKLQCPKSSKDFMIYYGAAHYFILIWVGVLILFYYVSKYLLDTSEISNDPLKLITILVGDIFITYRMAKVWGHEFFWQRRHISTRESENTPISTNNNNYNSV